MEGDGNWYCACPDSFKGPLCTALTSPIAPVITSTIHPISPSSNPVQAPSFNNNGVQTINRPPLNGEERGFILTLTVAMGSTVLVALVAIVVVARIRLRRSCPDTDADGDTDFVCDSAAVEDTELSLQVEDQTIT